MVTLVNRARMSTSTTGTGTITLGSASSGFQTFADAGVSDGDVVRYTIEDGNNWEIGTGTYTASGTTLTRTVAESSNSDAAISLSGSAIVFLTATAADFREETVGTITSSTVDLSTGTFFSDAPATSPTYVFSNPPASGTAYGFTIKVTPSATVTITWPTSVDFSSGVIPPTPASGNTNIYTFYTVDGGTTYYGFLAGSDMQ